MAIDRIDELLAVLRRTQLFAPEQVDEIERELAPSFNNAHSLGQYLQQVNWLTRYQFEQLFSGHWELLAIGPYTLLDRLGSGGISEVYKAWDTTQGRVVAVKVLRQHLASHSDAVRQFQRELEAMPHLNHPNVIQTFAAHQLNGMHYFAMEYVEGMDLDRFVTASGPLPVELATNYVRQVAQGLQHAHQFGLVHRDIKPANLFLINGPPASPSQPGPRRCGDPLVKILDWGLARIPPAPGDSSVFEPEMEKGALIGTADYVSPEQARDASVVDTRSDIYSLGCTFVYLLTGQPPFPGRTLMQKLLQHQQEPAPSVRVQRPDVPEELDQFIQKMMAKNPADRFQIPLLLIAPLRKFGPSTASHSVIRLPSSGVRPALTKPGSSAVLQRPEGTRTPRPTDRPGSSSNLRI